MLTPWIERMIQSYDSEGRSTSSHLKAHIIGVGEMPHSQVQGSEGPRNLIFLSDGVVQIPAVLTKSAWEHLQEKEDRECFNSLFNATVCIWDYSLQFHMATEQTKCRFILSVGELATTAAGPVKEKTPCCMSLPSVRHKICTTWRSLLDEGQAESQRSQFAFDLSELLGEWQHDCLHSVLEDVQKRLNMDTSHSVSPRPSTSSCNPSLIHRDTFVASAWDVDRVRYKGQKCFSIPLKYLLIPQEDAQQQKVLAQESLTPRDLLTVSDDRRTNFQLACKHTETVQASVEVRWRINRSAELHSDHQVSENACLPEDIMLQEDMLTGVTGSDLTSLSLNPWNIFPPPCDTASTPLSSSDATLHKTVACKATPKPGETVTSIQPYVHSSTESQTSVHNKEEHSYLPPYQKPPASCASTTGYSPSAPASSQEPIAQLSNLATAADASTHIPRQNLLTLDQQNKIMFKTFQMQKENIERIYMRPKGLRSEPTPDAPTIIVEEGEKNKISQSPPAWLFETQTAAEPKETGSYKHTPSAGKVQRRSLRVHSDYKPFSYSYQVSRQNLAAFTQFRMTETLVHWAVKHLVVSKQTGNPHKSAVFSGQVSCDGTRHFAEVIVKSSSLLLSPNPKT